MHLHYLVSIYHAIILPRVIFIFLYSGYDRLLLCQIFEKVRYSRCYARVRYSAFDSVSFSTEEGIARMEAFCSRKVRYSINNGRKTDEGGIIVLEV